MKTEKEVKEAVKKVEEAYAHVLTGKAATVVINAPRALMQLEAENKLRTLHWVLGTTYQSKLRGVE